MSDRLLTRGQVQQMRARVKLATKVLQGKYPGIQLAIETLAELGDELLAELREFDAEQPEPASYVRGVNGWRETQLVELENAHAETLEGVADICRIITGKDDERA